MPAKSSARWRKKPSASWKRTGVYKAPIVTEVTPLKAFYPAEDYHQDFMKHNPTYPYIVFWDAPKIAELERRYPDLLARP